MNELKKKIDGEKSLCALTNNDFFFSSIYFLSKEDFLME